ncbi:hypothetical protein [Pseudidiomarina sp.]|uniref:hypothetical protein n=1 Tax=Pseudidiomarina sp. TaxID=2081707 RepID=UPI003A97EF50
MLREDQVSALLEHCEELLGYTLSQIRGNLRSVEHRSAAIFELIAIDQLSEIGKIEYESREGQSPDIKLICESGTYAWIEIAFLYPKFWKEEQKREELDQAVTKEAKRRKIPPETIQLSFYHTREENKPKQQLPELHQIKKEISQGLIRDFFEEIQKNPNVIIEKKSDNYHFIIIYNPQKKGDFKVTFSTVMESTKEIKDNSLYRVLKLKCKQHKIKDEPRLILVGTDKNPAISSKFSHSKLDEQRVIDKIFTDNTSISGVLLVRIEPEYKEPKGTDSNTEFNVYINDNARNPLTPDIIDCFSKVDFRRWRYYNPIDKFEISNRVKPRNTSSSFKTRFDEYGPVIEIDEWLLIDIIAGRKKLCDEIPILKSNKIVFDPFKDVSHLREVSFIEENLREGKPRIAVLKFIQNKK